MITFKDSRTAYYDVDDTLLEWVFCDKSDEGATLVKYKGNSFYKKRLDGNIESLKRHSMAGHTIIVWSAGGSEWAECVIKALKLESHVDIILTKPDWYYDDKDVKTWFPKRQWHSEIE
jgi:hypothetical protein